MAKKRRIAPTQSLRRQRRYRRPTLHIESNDVAQRLYLREPAAFKRCLDRHFQLLKDNGLAIGQPRAGKFTTDCVIKGLDVFITTHISTGRITIKAFDD